MSLRTASLALASLVIPLAACPAPRTSPATWTAAKVFDDKTSDPRAIKLADEVVAAVGGPEAWAKVKELEWTQVHMVDGKPLYEAQHAWDRWNGRHRLHFLQGDSGYLVQYDVFEKTGKGWGLQREKNGTREKEATREQMHDMMGKASTQLAADGYLLCLPFKLRDPGVHLRLMGERPDANDPNRKLTVMRVSFDPGVGRDVYYLNVDPATKLPDSIEVVKAGKSDSERVGFQLQDWVEVNGLKFAGKRQNIGYAGETIMLSEIKTSGKPHEEFYVPEVQFPG